MKRLFWFLNILLAVITAVIYGLHYLPPSEHSFLLGSTLALPPISFIHILFVVYWAVGLSKRVILSLVCLLLGGVWLSCFVSFDSENTKNGISSNRKIKITSFNAHYFKTSAIKPVDRKSFKRQFFDDFVVKENPDIVFVQEGLSEKETTLWDKKYPFQVVRNNRNAIYSKYRILRWDRIKWKGYWNRCLYADVLVGEDIIRVFNVHLSSYGYSQQVEEIAESGFARLRDRLGFTFLEQEKQINDIIVTIKKSPYPVILCGDFNNLPNSYPYQQVLDKLGLKDTFLEEGSGFGATWDFSYFPMRIDYIFVPEKAKVLSHKVIKTKDWSDHYPVVAEIAL